MIILVDYGCDLRAMTKEQYDKFIASISYKGDTHTSPFVLFAKDEKDIVLQFNGKQYIFKPQKKEQRDVEYVINQLGDKLNLERMIQRHNDYFYGHVEIEITKKNLNFDILMAMLIQFFCDECGHNADTKKGVTDPDVYCQNCAYWSHGSCLQKRDGYKKYYKKKQKFMKECWTCTTKN